MKTILFLIVGALVAACDGSKNKDVKKDTPIIVSVSSVVQQSSNTITASGRIESKETALISTRVMGVITSIKVKAGDRVQKGQLLATISNADLMAKRAQAQATITEANAALVDAQKDYERFQDLYKTQSVSAKELENITLKYNSYKVKLEIAHQMKNEVDAMLTYTSLIAPFTGTVIQRSADEGSMANPGMPIIMMEQSGVFHITASVTETEISKLKISMPIHVMIKSIEKNFDGTIAEISPSSQFNGGQYSIKVSIPENKQQGLYSGMYATLSMDVQKKETEGNDVLVPWSAIVQHDQLTGIYTVSESQQALLHWVKLGKTVDQKVEVLSGLSLHEKFITQSEGKLYNGAPVQVK